MKHLILTLTLLGILTQLAACRVPISDEPVDPQSTLAPAQTTPGSPRDELEELEERLNTTDLGIQMTAEPEGVAVNERVTFTLTVTNHGPNPATNTQIVNHLPDGVVYRSSSVDCRESPQGILTCDLGELLARASATVTIEATVGESALPTLRATAAVANLAGPDSNSENDTATIYIQRRQ